MLRKREFEEEEMRSVSSKDSEHGPRNRNGNVLQLQLMIPDIHAHLSKTLVHAHKDAKSKILRRTLDDLCNKYL
jgi:hypothetical protein